MDNSSGTIWFDRVSVEAYVLKNPFECKGPSPRIIGTTLRCAGSVGPGAASETAPLPTHEAALPPEKRKMDSS